MGTRADFYVGRGVDSEWLGSIACDGYPDGAPESLFKTPVENEGDYRSRVAEILGREGSATLPIDGWPWPWETSATTDFAYAYDGTVWIACFGHGWHPTVEECEDEDCETPSGGPCVFPDMSAIKNVQIGGKRSGIIVIG